MDNKGQAALEYLMTYGWALIVIAIVVGVLVFIVSSPGGNVVCNSNDPGKVMVKAAQISSSTGGGTVQFTNLTGGDMRNVDVYSLNGAFASDNFIDDSTVTSGETVALIVTGTATAGTYASSSVGIHYIDYAGLARDANLTCSGPITIS